MVHGIEAGQRSWLHRLRGSDFETVDQMGAYTVVCDGKTLWRAVGSTHEYSRTPVSGPLFEMSGGGQEAQTALGRLRLAIERYWRLGDRLKSAKVVGEESITVGGTDVPCTVVRAEYAAPRAAEGIQSLTRTFWIQSQGGMLLQEETVTAGNLSPMNPFEQMESRSKIRYTRVLVDQPIPDSTFTYSPPENFREVDTLESVMQKRTSASRAMIGKPVPELTGNTLDGAAIALESLRGTAVLLDFWATWCEPCRDQMPAIARLYRETKDQGLVILGVNDDETTEKAIRLLKREPL
jgi:thiol-disulfide isomerase/thioredoxin